MFRIETCRSPRIVAGIVAATLLISCAADEAGPAAGEPVVAPAADPGLDGDDGDGVVGERPPPRFDWGDLDLEVALSDGWSLRDCEGDAPLRCLHGPDGSVGGTIELLRFEQHDGLLGAYDLDRAGAALLDLVSDFEAWLTQDRSTGCPHHTVEFEPSEPVTIDGAPAVIRGHRLLSPQGEVVERSLVAYIADGGDLALVTVNATAPGGCTHVEELDELSPTEFDHLHTQLRLLMADGSVPLG
jgi:hypothetical protein